MFHKEIEDAIQEANIIETQASKLLDEADRIVEEVGETAKAIILYYKYDKVIAECGEKLYSTIAEICGENCAIELADDYHIEVDGYIYDIKMGTIDN